MWSDICGMLADAAPLGQLERVNRPRLGCSEVQRTAFAPDSVTPSVHQMRANIYGSTLAMRSVVSAIAVSALNAIAAIG